MSIIVGVKKKVMKDFRDSGLESLLNLEMKMYRMNIMEMLLNINMLYMIFSKIKQLKYL